MPHLFLDCDISVWVDGNLFPIDIDGAVRHLKNDIAVFDGVTSHCIYDEAIDCKGMDSQTTIDEQIERYNKEGYPKDNGMFACTMIIRRHNKKVEEFNNMWWAEICRGSKRDQLSAMYCVKKTGIKLDYLPGDIYDNRYFQLRRHANP